MSHPAEAEEVFDANPAGDGSTHLESIKVFGCATNFFVARRNLCRMSGGKRRLDSGPEDQGSIRKV